MELVHKSPSRILDPSAIVTLSPHSILDSLARRLLSKACCQFTSGEDAWDDLEVPSSDAETLRNISTSFEATQGSSASTNDARSRDIANEIKKIVAWYFCDVNMRWRAPGWKLEREIEYILMTCAKVLSQENLLEHVLPLEESDQASGGAGRVRTFDVERSQKLKAAEALAFRACVLHTIFKRIYYPISHQYAPFEGEDTIQNLQEVASLNYQTASLQEKIEMTSTKQQRLAIMLEGWKIVPGLKTGFMTEVLNQWLHLIAVSERLPKAVHGTRMLNGVGEEVPERCDMGISAELDAHILERTKFVDSILDPAGPRRRPLYLDIE